MKQLQNHGSALLVVSFKRIFKNLLLTRGFPGGSEGNASACSAGDLGSIPVLGRSPGEGNSNPLWYSWLENPMEEEAW